MNADEQLRHEAYVAAGRELQTFRCGPCGVVEFYDPPEFYLLRFFQAAEAFDERHQACATPPPPGRRGEGSEG